MPTRKFISLFCFLLYGMTSIGATFQLHYCGGKLSNITVLLQPAKKDCCGKPIMPKKCCKSKKLELKKNSEQEKIITASNSGFKIENKLSSFVPINLNRTYFNLIESQTRSSINAPPGNFSTIPYYIWNRSILI